MGSILIVDDEPIVRSLLERMLEAAGHHVVAVGDAESAAEMLQWDAPDVVLCDVHLPVANGLWLTDRVRELAPCTAIVLISGDARVPPFETLRPGVVAFVLKPFVEARVLEALEDGMRWSRDAASSRTALAKRPNRAHPGRYCLTAS